MDPSSLLASRLYGKAALNQARPDGVRPSDKQAENITRTEETPNFINAVRDVASDISKTITTADQQSQDLMVGKADPHSVIEALASAELAVETAVTVRDRVVEAYQEILRMQI